MMRKLGWAGLLVLLVAAASVLYQFERANVETRELDDAAHAEAPGEFVELTDGLTHYQVGGPELGQVVVLVHGFSVPYYIWDTTYEALVAAGFRVVRFDNYGRGYSDRPVTDYNGDLYQRQIADLVRELGLSEPVDLIGLSGGGPKVARFAADSPWRVRRLVLVDPSVEGFVAFDGPRPLDYYRFSTQVLPGMADGQFTDFLYPDNYPDWADRYRVQMQYRGFRRAIFSSYRNFLTEDHLQHYRRLQGTGIPVMLIWGEHDETLPISNADKLMSVLEVDFMPVADSGHLPHIEKAAEVNAAIVEFLAGDESSR